jgi:hypothetical protein
MLVSHHLLFKVALSSEFSVGCTVFCGYVLILSEGPCIVLCYVTVYVLGQKTH